MKSNNNNGRPLLVAGLEKKCKPTSSTSSLGCFFLACEDTVFDSLFSPVRTCAGETTCPETPIQWRGERKDGSIRRLAFINQIEEKKSALGTRLDAGSNA